MKPDVNKPAFIIIDDIRNQMVNLRGQLEDMANANADIKNYLESTAGLMTCGLVTLHAAGVESKTNFSRRKGGIPFHSRGIGVDSCPCCYVCGIVRNYGTNNMYLNNIAAFVPSKEIGEKVLSLFDKGARLDFRPSEPNWIQVKVGACDAHLPCLKKLTELTRDGSICANDIAQSKMED